MWKVTLEDEYKKNPQLKGEDIQEVQVWIKKQPHLPSVTGKATHHFEGWVYVIFLVLEVSSLLKASTQTFCRLMPDSLYSSRQIETKWALSCDKRCAHCYKILFKNYLTPLNFLDKLINFFSNGIHAISFLIVTFKLRFIPIEPWAKLFYVYERIIFQS